MASVTIKAGAGGKPGLYDCGKDYQLFQSFIAEKVLSGYTVKSVEEKQED